MTERIALWRRIAVEAIVCAEAKAKPVVAALALSVASKAEIECTLQTRRAIVVDFVLDGWLLTATAVDGWRGFGARNSFRGEGCVRYDRAYSVVRMRC